MYNSLSIQYLSTLNLDGSPQIIFHRLNDDQSHILFQTLTNDLSVEDFGNIGSMSTYS